MLPSILFVLHDFLPQALAGTELHVLRLAQVLARTHRVTILHTVRDAAQAQYAVSRGTVQGLSVIRVVQNYPYRPLAEELRDAALEGLFSRLLAELHPDVVHFHHLGGWCLSLPALAKTAGYTVCYTLHDYHLLCPAGGQLYDWTAEKPCLGPSPARCGPCHARYAHREGRLETLALRLSRLPGLPAGLPFRLYRRLPPGLQGVIRRLNPPGAPPGPQTCSQAEARQQTVLQLFQAVHGFLSPSADLARRFVFSGLPADGLRLLPNPGPGSWPADPLPAAPPLRLLYLGTLAPHKGLLRLVEAVTALEGLPVFLTVAGSLTAFSAYVRRLRQAAGSRVSFVGSVAPLEVPALLARHHLLVLASEWPENAPLTILEAFAAGRPVLAPAVGGLPELVQHGRNGLLYRPSGPPVWLKGERAAGTMAKDANVRGSSPSSSEVHDFQDFFPMASLEETLEALCARPALLPALAAGVRPPATPEAHAQALLEAYAWAASRRTMAQKERGI